MSKINDLINSLEIASLEFEMSENDLVSCLNSLKCAPYPRDIEFAERQVKRAEQAKYNDKHGLEKAYKAIEKELKIMGVIQ